MPNRIIKESICYSESIKPLSWFEEVFFYRLIVNADDFGRLDGRAEMLQAKLFPLRRDITDSTIKKALNALTAAGMVQTYEYDGRPFLQLTAWEQHQTIRAKKSKFPEPENNCMQMISNDFKCSRNPIQSESNPNPNPNPNIVGEESPPDDISKPKDPPIVEQIKTYTDNEDLKNSLSAFVEMRKKIKKPVTEYGFKLLLDKLDKLATNDRDKLEIVNNSVANCWQGFFELKERSGQYGEHKPNAKQDNSTSDWGIKVTRL